MEKNEKIFEQYENIRQALSGLGEILKINFNEKDFYYQAGMDNLKALHENVVEMMRHVSSPREVRIKLREMECDDLEANEPFPF
ncbi:MAG: hypothetical protein JW891_10950 [Candidatus Lokiarchaeota archaeon]|nr:hypothetical protein [Candidatus Lokiarchaeota archaeon]